MDVLGLDPALFGRPFNSVRFDKGGQGFSAPGRGMEKEQQQQWQQPEQKKHVYVG